ncbi:MAG: murein biosynthesis integral membrane protein MurJ [Deltaproteobacteria bacterium]|nr:murein biosynthesis integral membrane protein MurJ [Deltaproteobacteria bacterium]
MGTGLSRVLGAVRDVVIANVLGAGASSDAFWIAFTVPNVFRRFVADEGLTGALIPAVAKAEEEEGTSSARRLANAVLGALLLANVALCVFGFFAADFLVYAFAAKFAEDPEKFRLTAEMTRWMMPFVAFVSLVSLMEGLLNHRGHFFVPKVAPGLVSAGIVASAILLGSRFEEPAWALVVGVLVGGVVHVLVNVPVLWKRWGPIGISFAFRNPRFLAILRELSKVVAIGVFAQVNILVLRQLAALLGDGAITRYWYANRLVDLSQGIIAVAIGSALLPGIAKAVAARDHDALRADLQQALRLAGFLLIPVAVTLLWFAQPITAILFRQGAYTWVDVQWTAWTLQALVPFLLAVAGINIVKKVYFAMDDRNPLLAVGAVGVVVTAGLGLVLIQRWDILGLALALSVSTTLQLVAYVWLLRRRVGTTLGFGALLPPLGKMVAAALPMGLVLWLAAPLGSWEEGPLHLPNFAVLVGGLVAAGLVYLGLAWFLRIEELHSVLARIRRR